MDPQPIPAALPNLDTLPIKVAELLLVSLFDGGILTLGIRSIFLLTTATDKIMHHRKLWLAYIVTLMLFNISFLFVNFIWTFAWAIYQKASGEATQATFVAFYMSDLMGIIMLGLTDGVLVSLRQCICTIHADNLTNVVYSNP